MTCSSQSGREAVSSEIYQFAVRQADKERKRVNEGKLTLNCLVSQGDWDVEELSHRIKGCKGRKKLQSWVIERLSWAISR